jgi:hypothetical protein
MFKSFEYRKVECDECGTWFEATLAEDLEGYEWQIVDKSTLEASTDIFCQSCLAEMEYYRYNLPLGEV